ncbi:uncharacterized protein LOC112564606 [Pomacea canaliculata]|uniref:uncharacterized protein LOC112564606 n=1 Tax=Pomacea canaliculata TaxID=400727 RepID=UPI000D725D29|nr:uncharacterized protein LOC112564606 [Pomacea canaliculata]
MEAAVRMGHCCLTSLSDDVLLLIFQYIDHIDLANIRLISSRFQSISEDRQLVRHISFASCYRVTDQILCRYLKPVFHQVETLDLNHCYWLTYSAYDAIGRCVNLQTLNVLQCRITPKHLCLILARLTKLRSLAVTIVDMQTFQAELHSSGGAQKVMQNLRCLTLHFRGTLQYTGHHIKMQFEGGSRFLDYFYSLEELHVLGFPNSNKGIPPYVLYSLITNPEAMKRIRCLSISDAVDSFARMFFFSTLLEVCKQSTLYLTTLLQPMGTPEHLKNKPHYVETLKNIEQMELLDISRTVQPIPNEIFSLDRAVNLQYLNVADNTMVSSQSLHILADNCPRLVSINLRNCHSILLKSTEGSSEEKIVDSSGLQTLLLNCSELRHINLSGVHLHADDFAHSSFSSLCHLLAINSNWKSVALSPCCLCPMKVDEITTTMQTTGNKRVMVRYSDETGVKRQRIGIQPPDLHMSVEEELTSELGKLVRVSPNMESFELIGAGFRSACNKKYGLQPETFNSKVCAYATAVGEQELLCIRQWKKLVYLQLTAVPGIFKGDFLAGIVRNCVQLKQLFLSHLGMGVLCCYRQGLRSALPLAHCLKDLRLEQPGLQLNESLWTSLGQVSTLERLCVVARDGIFEKESVIVDYVKSVPSLIALQLLTNNTLTSCRNLQTKLAQTFSQERRPFSQCIFPLKHPTLLEFASSVPDVHLDELTILNSTICLRPPGWGRMPKTNIG